MDATYAYKSELSRYLKAFGGNVRRLRTADERGISQEQLAGMTGLHRTEIGKIEQGLVEPRLTTLFILADALGVSIDELVAGLWVPEQRKPAPHTRRRQLEA
jgi:transcriptional regulator with XRE-family HTH domain